MPTEIIQRDPPPLAADRDPAPTTPLDNRIMAALASGEPLQLREVVAAAGASTHHVHARLQVLSGRGLVLRIAPLGAPSRGPGASVYQLAVT